MDKSELKPQVRLYSILAREANRAVVFRRGPSKQVQLLLWLEANVYLEFKPALVWCKPHAPSRGRYELQMHILGLKERDGPWYLIDHVVKDTTNGSTLELPRTEWADWCHSGDLLFAKDGRLFRLGFSDDGVLNDLPAAKLLIDLNDRTFTELAAPVEAKQWFS